MAYDPNLNDQYRQMAQGKSDAEIAAWSQQNGFSAADIAHALGTSEQDVVNRGYNPNVAGGYTPPTASGILSSPSTPAVSSTPAWQTQYDPAHNADYKNWANGKSYADIAQQAKNMNMSADQVGSVFGVSGADVTKAGYNPNVNSGYTPTQPGMLGGYNPNPNVATHAYTGYQGQNGGDKYSDAQVKQFLAQNPNMSPADYIKNMQTYGVDLNQLARVTGMGQQQLMGIANQAGISNGDLFRGGVIGGQDTGTVGNNIFAGVRQGYLKPGVLAAFNAWNGDSTIDPKSYTPEDLTMAKQFAANGYWGPTGSGNPQDTYASKPGILGIQTFGSSGYGTTATGATGTLPPGASGLPYFQSGQLPGASNPGAAPTPGAAPGAGTGTGSGTVSGTASGSTAAGALQMGNPQLGSTTPWDVSADQTVEGRINQLTNGSNPVVQQAVAQAMGAANDRGLANSSMAVQAGQAAAYQAALPIAQADAATSAKAAGYNADQSNQFNLAQFSAANQRSIAALQSATSQWTAQLDADTRKTLQQMQTAAANQHDGWGMSTTLYGTMQQGIAQIMQSTTMDYNAKLLATQNLINATKTGFDMISKYANVPGLGDYLGNLQWGSTQPQVTQQQAQAQQQQQQQQSSADNPG